MRRREFIAGLGGAAAWPVATRAQQGDRVRRIGFLSSLDENDRAAKTSVSAFTQALAYLGWTDGRNVRMDFRWAGGGDLNRMRALAQELVGLQPDIIVTGGTATIAAQRETRTIPIVFANLGLVSSIVERVNQPSGNITGFAGLEASLGGKWLELRGAKPSELPVQFPTKFESSTSRPPRHSALPFRRSRACCARPATSPGSRKRSVTPASTPPCATTPMS